MSKTLHRSLEAKLAALNGPEWDSSDEEELAKPQVAKKSRSKKAMKSPEETKSKKQLKREETEDSKVIYLGHLPPAFEEVEILKFLSQFGQVVNIKLSRSERTGNSRGYAFVEFADNAVAAIVADTMSGYFLMGERRLVCHIVPKDKIHPDLFRGAKRNLVRAKVGIMPSKQLKILHDKQRKKVNEEKSVEQLNKITKRLLIRERKKREQLKSLGIDYDFPGYGASSDMTSDKKRKMVDDDEMKEKKEQKKSKNTENTPSNDSTKNKSRAGTTEEVPVANDDQAPTRMAESKVKSKTVEQTPSKGSGDKKNDVKGGKDKTPQTPIDTKRSKSKGSEHTPGKLSEKKVKTATPQTKTDTSGEAASKTTAVTHKKIIDKKSRDVKEEKDEMARTSSKTPLKKKTAVTDATSNDKEQTPPKRTADKTPNKPAGKRKNSLQDKVQTPENSKISANKKPATDVKKKQGAKSGSKRRKSVS